ncbi:MAG: hypothetical protein WC256_03965 [Desulfurivibrionaceae bacterium]|jgi:hypothetical protein
MERLIVLLEIVMPANMLVFLEKYIPAWRDSVWKLKRRFMLWLHGVVAAVCRLAILSCCVCILYWLLLSIAMGGWNLFQHTMIGQVFRSNVSPKLYEVINDLLVDRDLLYLSYVVVGHVLVVSLLLGAVVQLLALRRFFHQARGVIIYSLWAILCAKVSIGHLANAVALDTSTAFYLILPPVMAIYGTSFALCEKIFPELNFLLLIRVWLNIKRNVDIREAAKRSCKK